MPEDASSGNTRGHDLVERIQQHLNVLYGDEGDETYRRLVELMERFEAETSFDHVAPAERLTERDSVLITYADQVHSAGEAPLATLKRLLDTRLTDTVTGVHLLPFFPATSDDGFSVVDYLEVDEDFGTWQDVSDLAAGHRLMFDAVVNHVSASSHWFQGLLAGEAPYDAYFITVDPEVDLSAVVRPRATPVLTPFETDQGTKHVWTTFSADQLDLDYANPDVLVEVVHVLLEYVERGAEIIRLDAVTFLWKEIGTSCVHHPNTHRILKLMRAVMEHVAPHVVLLTETNVPHQENIGYFGNGRDEAQMVYNFALPPLVLHSFHTGNASQLQAWARGLGTPSDETTFFNFLASHDGIGVRPVEQILPRDAVDALVERVRAHGGLVSTKRNSDGSESPYELNITYFDALSDPASDERIERQVERFMTAHAIMLAMAGVPGIYVHSLLGSRNTHDEVARTGRARSINRAKFALSDLERELGDRDSLRSRVLEGFRTLLRARRGDAAFSPRSSQEILDTPAGVFSLLRGDRVYCLHNLTAESQRISATTLPSAVHDMLAGKPLALATGLQLAPFETRWLAVG